MNQRKIVKIMSLALLAALFTAAPLLANCGHCQKGEKACSMLDKLPNLTPELKTKLEQSMQVHMTEMMPLKENLQKQHVVLKELMAGNDLKKIEAKIDEVTTLQAGLMKKCAAHRLAVRGLLSDEQKKVFDEMGCACMGGMKGQEKTAAMKKDCGMKGEKQEAKPCEKHAEQEKEKKS